MKLFWESWMKSITFSYKQAILPKWSYKLFFLLYQHHFGVGSLLSSTLHLVPKTRKLQFHDKPIWRHEAGRILLLFQAACQRLFRFHVAAHPLAEDEPIRLPTFAGIPVARYLCLFLLQEAKDEERNQKLKKPFF